MLAHLALALLRSLNSFNGQLLKLIWANRLRSDGLTQVSPKQGEEPLVPWRRLGRHSRSLDDDALFGVGSARAVLIGNPLDCRAKLDIERLAMRPLLLLPKAILANAELQQLVVDITHVTSLRKYGTHEIVYRRKFCNDQL